MQKTNKPPDPRQIIDLTKTMKEFNEISLKTIDKIKPNPNFPNFPKIQFICSEQDKLIKSKTLNKSTISETQPISQNNFNDLQTSTHFVNSNENFSSFFEPKTFNFDQAMIQPAKQNSMNQSLNLFSIHSFKENTEVLPNQQVKTNCIHINSQETEINPQEEEFSNPQLSFLSIPNYKKIIIPKQMFIFQRKPFFDFHHFENSIPKSSLYKESPNNAMPLFNQQSIPAQTSNNELNLSDSFTQTTVYRPQNKLDKFNNFQSDRNCLIAKENIDIHAYNLLLERKNLLLQRKIEREEKLRELEAQFSVEKEIFQRKINELTKKLQSNSNDVQQEFINGDEIDTLKIVHSCMNKLIIDIHRMTKRFRAKFDIRQPFANDDNNVTIKSIQPENELNHAKMLHLIDELNDLICQLYLDNI